MSDLKKTSFILPRFPQVLMIIALLMAPGGKVYAAETGTIRISGTGTALGSMHELAKSFQKRYPDINVIIGKSIGSTGGIKALLAGRLDIALSGRPLKDDEAKEGAVSMEYARTPLLFVTNHSVEGMEFGIKHIASIYAGEVKNWPDGTPIRLILRPFGEAETKLLKGISKEMSDAVDKAQSREGMMIALTDQDAADMLEQVKGSFGTSSLSLVITEKRSLNILPIDGVTPDVKTLAGGRYPYYRPLYLISGPGSSPLVKKFIDFIYSKEGKAILTKTGNILKR